MLRLRYFTESTARTKNGQPPQRTTGVASSSSSQGPNGWDMKASMGPTAILPMVRTRSGTVSAAETQKRTVMLRSSGSSGSSAVIVRGSRAMPQIGQLPGSPRTISGCIGQVHSVFFDGAAGAFGSSAMPHLGHEPGPSFSTSGCIGHV